jgi:hypothetical protein
MSNPMPPLEDEFGRQRTQLPDFKFSFNDNDSSSSSSSEDEEIPKEVQKTYKSRVEEEARRIIDQERRKIQQYNVQRPREQDIEYRVRQKIANEQAIERRVLQKIEEEKLMEDRLRQKLAYEKALENKLHQKLAMENKMRQKLAMESKMRQKLATEKSCQKVVVPVQSREHEMKRDIDKMMRFGKSY